MGWKTGASGWRSGNVSGVGDSRRDWWVGVSAAGVTALAPLAEAAFGVKSS